MENVLDALGCHTADELSRAVSGFRLFGLDDVADLVESIADRTKRSPTSAAERAALEDQLIAEYESACPERTTETAFEDYFDRQAEDFAPLSEQDIARRQDTIDFIRRL